jgi:hypothetical protein
MSRIADNIRKYISCHQFGDEHYGEWGILTFKQRELIKELIETCNMFERTADEFGKANMKFKQQLAESEEEIKTVREQNGRVIEKLDLIVRSNQELELALSLAIKTLYKSQGSYCDYCEDANKRICSPLISNCHRHIVNYFKKEAQKQLKEMK